MLWVFIVCSAIGWLYWRFLKFFIGPIAKAIDNRIISFIANRGVQPDMAKGIARLLEVGLLVGIILLGTIH